MEIGDKELSIFLLNNKSSILRDNWWKSKKELSKEIIYIERELVGKSKSGSPIYFKYRFIKDGSIISTINFHECQCTKIYGDIWVHALDGKVILNRRDYHPSTINNSDIIFIPFDGNLGRIRL